ncbi:MULTISPECIES: PCC domain-containing protein [Rhodococcus]|uniref:DUF296 domain-containing protein n=1 Tax=Rhodococcus oxybenzonivorans TaxID=1990687 RepID=A0AAE4UX91_9NOCA|nr:MULTISPECIES: DUF296 domain-containing protein [Rhodococcus]MDV7241684.1 DUF296 domain-containing protein [Rhodococcus oxybenzonivorans]MDV7264705.1 DUF296 domain-containing protein [Rhodococcus oxybenzonivorans]MDV7273782.1 DUF296 domain-containing protein [Rhodococcus oxybenzonivorans]MDV7333966.1 DUF296 domain-containing protein [Rhodococcus oxybenzonivorans]MDV7343385.1 DUF296 domain-containing protein [Rhodococcus oxybenzonivorans]
MSTTDTSSLTGVPRLTHPGPPAAQRVEDYPATLHHVDTELLEGRALLPALHDAVFARGFASAFGELRGGTFAEFDYYIPSICHAGTSVATFSEPRRGHGPAAFVRGGVTIGKRDGKVFAHCHAMFVGADGIMRAGHLIPDSVVLGAGVRADLYATADVAMTVTPDPEINFPVFQPQPVHEPTTTYVGGMRSVVARIHPNVDIVAAVEHLAETHGFDTAIVRGKVGSFVGATLTQGDQIVTAPGPATEVMYLDGAVTRDADGRPHAELSCAAVAVDGNVYTGSVVRGHNPIAMTFELAMSEPGSTLP